MIEPFKPITREDAAAAGGLPQALLASRHLLRGPAPPALGGSRFHRPSCARTGRAPSDPALQSRCAFRGRSHWEQFRHGCAAKSAQAPGRPRGRRSGSRTSIGEVVFRESLQGLLDGGARNDAGELLNEPLTFKHAKRNI